MLSAVVVSLFVLLLAVHNSKSGFRTEPILFDFYRKQKLTLQNGAKTQSTQVDSDEMSCLTECVRVHWCQSCNFKTTQESNGLHVCELLSSDRFTISNNLVPDEAYHHFNFKTQCHIKNKPCANGGECVGQGESAKCKCGDGLIGEQCREGNWTQWSSWSVGCYLPSVCVPKRTRNCTSPAPYSPNCTGPAEETKYCPPLPVVDTTGCKNPLGMEDGTIQDSQINASSIHPPWNNVLFYYPKHARLNEKATANSVGGWIPAPPKIDEYIQVDLGSTKVITMVATQGRDNTDFVEYMTKYSLAYSDDAINWTNYEGDCVKVLPANIDQHSVVTRELEIPIRARYIRLIVKGFQGFVPVVRMEFYGCLQLP